MIENNNEISKDLEKALQALEQSKQRVANVKKKQNEKKRKAGKPFTHKALSSSTADKYIRSKLYSNAHQSVFTKENNKYADTF